MHCWNCGTKLEVDDDPEYNDIIVVGKHRYCSGRCATEGENGDPTEPVDYDQHDRNAAASERIANHFAER